MGQFLTTGASLLASAEPEGPSYWGLISYVLFVVAILFVLMAVAKKDLKSRVFKNPIAQMFEQLYLFVEQMCVSIIGPHGRKYVPLIGTFWLMIFLGNLVALFFPTSPTADLSFNLGMALISIAYVQWEGMKSNGIFGHLSHFAGPRLGIALIPISIMIFVIEIISELMKNVSLSLRLFGNIHGGHMAVEAMNKLGEGIYVPVGAFLLPIKLLTCLVQALIFSLLTCVYISLVTGHHEEDHAPAHGEAEPAAAH
jgi:F-type H+-transporting ATPase subunit a